MLPATTTDFQIGDVELWMWQAAATRPGFWTITVPVILDRTCCARAPTIYRKINFTQEEYALIEKVVQNQIYAESKTKIAHTVEYQRSIGIWDTGSVDHVAMRTLGVWAVALFKSQQSRGWGSTCCFSICGMARLRIRLSRTKEPPTTTTPKATPPPAGGGPSGGSPGGPTPPSPPTTPSNPSKSKKNKLGYQAEGEEYKNEHPGGGVDDEDSEIRAKVQGRIIKQDCGVGVVGQTTDDTGKKQICGVLSQPIAKEPNVYAQELLNAIKAIEERIEKKQRPYAGTPADELKITRMVNAAIHGKHAPFSPKKVMDCLYQNVYEQIKSKKWTDERISQAIEKLCQQVDPKFKLKALVKLEPMNEEKSPRLLISDEDVGQVMALMTIYTMEKIQKTHFPEKGIKGLSKRAALERVMKSLKVPKKIAKRYVTIFEGDGSAWDTTCSAAIRALVENPIVEHIADYVDAMINSTPTVWTEAHKTINSEKKLKLTYSKNKEFKNILIDAIRRSGHRGTSCLNWWMNFVCWHCAVFKDPELFLENSKRWGEDVTGNQRWMNSAFEGDDSLLSTSPKIEPKKELHTAILQFWERIGFNMKIEFRDQFALFVGFNLGLDEQGPKCNPEKNEYMLIPEVARCFGKSGTSCSPGMIQAFKENNIVQCRKLAGSAAISRAFEFAGLSPTISNKFLEYALECDFTFTHDLTMRTNEEYEDKNELVAAIRGMNMTCNNESEILESTGFPISQTELGKFQDYIWQYETLCEWEAFRDSLPKTWRD